MFQTGRELGDLALIKISDEEFQEVQRLFLEGERVDVDDDSTQLEEEEDATASESDVDLG